MLNWRTTLSLGILFSTPFATSYYIADTCVSTTGPDRRTDISQAINEAKGVARYAAWRIDQGPPDAPAINEGYNADVVTELLGDRGTGIPRFKEKMNRVASTVGTRAPSEDNTVKIHCGDFHMRQFPTRLPDGTQGIAFWDPQYPNSLPIPYKSSRPCERDPETGAWTSGFTYSTGNAPGGNGAQFVIVLCDNIGQGRGAGVAALKLPEISTGVEWARNYQGMSIDFAAARYLSRAILHEIMHCISSPPNHYLDGELPSGSGEAYGWQSIQELDANDKLFNADSYAILAYVLWFKANQYASDGSFGRYMDLSIVNSVLTPDWDGHLDPDSDSDSS